MAHAVALDELQARLGVRFRNISFLRQALRHRSAVMDRPLESNERMEFLGDAILGQAVCARLYALFPDWSEGELAKAKAYLVSEPTLAATAAAIGLSEVVEMSAGESTAGGRHRRSILSDVFEALVAAVYLDQGLRAAHMVVRKALDSAMRDVRRDEYHQDYKSQLQEHLQAHKRKTPHYRIAGETGADHDKTFVAQALTGRKVIGEGEGKSKKQAEQEAARAALQRLGAETG